FFGLRGVYRITVIPLRTHIPNEQIALRLRLEALGKARFSWGWGRCGRTGGSNKPRINGCLLVCSWLYFNRWLLDWCNRLFRDRDKDTDDRLRLVRLVWRKRGRLRNGGQWCRCWDNDLNGRLCLSCSTRIPFFWE